MKKTNKVTDLTVYNGLAFILLSAMVCNKFFSMRPEVMASFSLGGMFFVCSDFSRFMSDDFVEPIKNRPLLERTFKFFGSLSDQAAQIFEAFAMLCIILIPLVLLNINMDKFSIGYLGDAATLLSVGIVILLTGIKSQSMYNKIIEEKDQAYKDLKKKYEVLQNEIDRMKNDNTV